MGLKIFISIFAKVTLFFIEKRKSSLQEKLKLTSTHKVQKAELVCKQNNAIHRLFNFF